MFKYIHAFFKHKYSFLIKFLMRLIVTVTWTFLFDWRLNSHLDNLFVVDLRIHFGWLSRSFEHLLFWNQAQMAWKALFIVDFCIEFQVKINWHVDLLVQRSFLRQINFKRSEICFNHRWYRCWMGTEVFETIDGSTLVKSYKFRERSGNRTKI